MKYLLVVLSTMLTACSTTMTEQQLADGTVVKRPAIFAAHAEGASAAEACRRMAVTVMQTERAMLLNNVDINTDRGLMVFLVGELAAENRYAEVIRACNEPTQQMIAGIQRVDERRLDLAIRGVHAVGFVAGGYIIGNAVEGIVNAATRRAQGDTNVVEFNNNGGGASSGSGGPALAGGTDMNPASGTGGAGGSSTGSASFSATDIDINQGTGNTIVDDLSGRVQHGSPNFETGGGTLNALDGDKSAQQFGGSTTGDTSPNAPNTFDDADGGNSLF